MIGRLWLGLVAVFWITMNVLLWRAEFGTAGSTGGRMSEAVVWERILTAPDDSTLEITRNGRRIGFCHWSPTTPQTPPPDPASGGSVPDGMVTQPAGYVLKLEGNVFAEETGLHANFTFQARLSTNRSWQEFTLRLGARPATLEIHAQAADRILVISGKDGESRWSRTLSFDELRDPRGWLGELGGPALLALVGALPASSNPSELAAGLSWEARTDWLKVGSSQVRSYRLEARWADRYPVVLIVSRVGEIMRAELPGGIRLENQMLQNL